MHGYFKICKFEKHYVDIYIYKKLHFSHKKKICTFPINKDSGILMSPAPVLYEHLHISWAPELLQWTLESPGNGD